MSALLLIVACSPKAGGETESSSVTETTASSEGTTDTTTASSEGTADTTAPTTTEGGQVCEPFLDQEVTGPAVTVTIENHRAEAVFVLPGPQCSGQEQLGLVRDGVSLRFRDGSCTFTCADQFAGECSCPADCPVSPTIRIEPGGVYRVHWSGSLYVPVNPPASCFALECGNACEQRQQAGAGAYVFTSAAGTAPPSGCDASPELCTCTANADGWCELPDLEAEAFAEVVELAGEFTYPEQTAAVLIVE